MNNIRNSIKAVIRRENTLLMIQCQDADGEFYILPGGGQELGETMPEALRRECREEIGCLVEVGELLAVCEYIHHRVEFQWQRSLHQIEFMFGCVLPPGEEPKMGGAPDDIQVGVRWVPLESLPGLRHYPGGLADALQKKTADTSSAPVYMGNVVHL